MLLNIGITLLTFILMECVTWLTHKYVMHGFMWYFHEDHHQPKYQGVFEKNDLFFAVFAIPSITLLYLGIEDGVLNYLFFIGLGIMLYGWSYFLVHDVIIHRRFNWFKTSKNRYISGLRKAHKVHHKELGKHGAKCFGMLFVPFKYFSV